jgi:hypothetical protein
MQTAPHASSAGPKTSRAAWLGPPPRWIFRKKSLKENGLRQKNKSLEEANTALNVLMKKMGEQSSADEEALRGGWLRSARLVLPSSRRSGTAAGIVEMMQMTAPSSPTIIESLSSELRPH